MLDAVVEDCVNKVGVDLNTASVPLLSRVSGLSPSVARAVVRWREAHGAFSTRRTSSVNPSPLSNIFTSAVICTTG